MTARKEFAHHFIVPDQLISFMVKDVVELERWAVNFNAAISFRRLNYKLRHSSPTKSSLAHPYLLLTPHELLFLVL